MDTRERILEAAERVIRLQGLAGATTRQIAREAGCADGTLYVHFRDRTELFLSLLEERVPPLNEELLRLHTRVGRKTVRFNLERAVAAALAFHAHAVPLFAALFGEPQILNEYRRRLRERNRGPHRSREPLVAYLREEQQRGRVLGSVDIDAAGAALMNACFGHVFSRSFFGESSSVEDDKRFAKALVGCLWRGMAPDSDD